MEEAGQFNMLSFLVTGGDAERMSGQKLMWLSKEQEERMEKDREKYENFMKAQLAEIMNENREDRIIEFRERYPFNCNLTDLWREWPVHITIGWWEWSPFHSIPVQSSPVVHSSIPSHRSSPPNLYTPKMMHASFVGKFYPCHESGNVACSPRLASCHESQLTQKDGFSSCTAQDKGQLVGVWLQLQLCCNNSSPGPQARPALVIS